MTTRHPIQVGNFELQVTTDGKGWALPGGGFTAHYEYAKTIANKLGGVKEVK